MQNTLFVLLIILCVLLLILVTAVLYLFWRYIRLREKSLGSLKEEKEKILYKKMPDEIKSEVLQAKDLSSGLAGKFCIDHPENHAKGTCSISDEAYCELCITKEKEVRLARKYLHMFLDTNWEESFFFNNDKVGAEKYNELMRIKNQLWRDLSVPVIAQKQFKINIENDNIETFTVVLTRNEDQTIIDNRFGFLKEEK